MSTMKHCKELFIATARGNGQYYVAKLSEDENSIIIQRVLYNEKERHFHTLVNFIDCNDYIFSAIEIADRQYSAASRAPSAVYRSNIPDKYAKYRDYFVECITNYGNVLRVHIESYDEEADVFNKFVITEVQGEKELVVAYLDIDNNNELGVILSGYPAGYEIGM